MVDFKFEPPVVIVGLGYVGLPLAIELGKIVETIGYDIREGRIAELARGVDANGESTTEEIEAAHLLRVTTDPSEIHKSRFIIVAVPTPVTDSKQPDLSLVEAATRTVGRHLQPGSIVVFEPTVYPGVTEDICVPILEKESGLRYRQDFKVGYSPERINPGDRYHTVSSIIKIVSGCDQESLDIIASVYGKVTRAGVYRAASIRTAEAAKVLENTQRDLNIALMNELAIILHRMDVDAREVIDAAGTKWNFQKFYPGLVGGHCIGVDPYYLTHKAQLLGYNPEIILAGRRINDGMGKYVAEQTVKLLIKGGKAVKGAKVLVCGLTFKENVSDIRNSRVIDVYRELEDYGVHVQVTDPMADPHEVKKEYGIDLAEHDPEAPLDAVVLAVNHLRFKPKLTALALVRQLTAGGAQGVLVDVKGMFERQDFAATRVLYWRL